MKRNDREFRKILHDLRERFAPAHPVKVRRVNLSPDQGWSDCALIRSDTNGPYFLIRIHRPLNSPAWDWALIHEWAHALSWNSESKGFKDHNVTWGIWYAKLYQEFFEE